MRPEDVDDTSELSEWEIATGWIGGHLPTPGCGDPPVSGDRDRGGDGATTPLAALERAVLPALLRPPCLVSFSGGMDSTLVLAVAALTAQRNGLAAPIPISWQVTDAPLADESARQSALLADLRLDVRVILRAGDDLDFVGPVARRLLSRYGLRFPGNLHLHLPLMEQAAGGSLLTGVGGDQVLSAWAARPLPVRVSLARHRFPRETYLHRTVHRTLLRQLELEAGGEPGLPIERLSWHVGSRSLRMGVGNLRAVALDLDVQVINPLLDMSFHRALVRSVAHVQHLSRADVISAIAGSDLPPSVGRHRSKARFGEVFVRRHTRSLIAGWRGGGVPTDLVDAAALRRVWSSASFPTATALLLQAVWLSGNSPSASTAQRDISHQHRRSPADTSP